MPKTDPAIRYLRENHLLGQLAQRLGVSKQATAKWRRIPAERVLAVAKITGLDPRFLRDDLYPADLHHVLPDRRRNKQTNDEVSLCQQKVDKSRVSGGGAGPRQAKSMS